MKQFNLTFDQLKQDKKQVYSQSWQDGVLEKIFNQIGEDGKMAIEFGADEGYHLSNTAYLESKDWCRILMDAKPKSKFVDKKNINAENINEIFSDYGFDKMQVEYLSIDVDGNDYWIWKALEVMPKVVSIEYNSKFTNDVSVAIEYNTSHKWEGDDYYSASLLALKKLGERKGYVLVCVVDQLDAIFIRKDLVSKDYIAPSLDELLPKPIIAHEKVSNKKWIQV